MSKIKERNKQIYKKYEDGASIGSLSSEYGLAEKTIEHIVAKIRQRSQDFGKDKLLDDAEKKQQAVDQLRKIRVGDVVKVRHRSIDACGYKRINILTGPVIYRDGNMITVQGDHYAESFCMVDLVSDLVGHIPT